MATGIANARLHGGNAFARGRTRKRGIGEMMRSGAAGRYRKAVPTATKLYASSGGLQAPSDVTRGITVDGPMGARAPSRNTAGARLPMQGPSQKSVMEHQKEVLYRRRRTKRPLAHF